jgi:hypothetical protein
LIIDLKNLKKKNKISARVCIIGGGTVGLFLAQRLRLNNVPVTVIEAGGEKTNELKKNIYKFKKYPYYEDLTQKKFILGGTSTIWGGQMIPIRKTDMLNRSYVKINAWSVTYESIARYYQIVMRLLRFKSIKQFIIIKNKKKTLNFLNKDFDYRLSTFIKDKVKNFKNFFYKQIKKDKDYIVYINSKVLRINNSNKSNTVKNIIAKSKNGNILDIKTEIVIICCGVLESTRLLIIYNKKNNNCINKSPLGNFFNSQLSVTCGEFIIKNWKEFILFFSPIYVNKLIHNPRFELKSKFQKKNKIPSSYCHFLFLKNKTTKYDMLIKVFKNKNFNLKFTVLTIILSFSEIIKNIYNLFYFRILFNRVWFYKPKKILFSIVLEQVPSFNNKLFMNSNSNKLVIDWDIERKNINYIKLISKTFQDAWIKSGFNKIAELRTSIPNNANFKKFIKPTYHTAGSLRMGSKKSNSVVNSDLKIWGINNLYVCSTAVFPTTSCSNTGLTLLALATRLESNIKNKLARKQ